MMNYMDSPIHFNEDSKEETFINEMKKNSSDINCLDRNNLDNIGRNSILNQKVKHNTISFDFLNSNFLIKETKNLSNRLSMLNHPST